jgi:hypothetical protein
MSLEISPHFRQNESAGDFIMKQAIGNEDQQVPNESMASLAGEFSGRLVFQPQSTRHSPQGALNEQYS